MNYISLNIARTIFNEIGLDTDKLYVVRNVVHEKLQISPLFTTEIYDLNIIKLSDMLSDFINDCIEEILWRIV